MVQRGRPDGNEFFPGNTKRAPAVPRRDRERGAAGLPSRARTEVEGAPASARTQPSRGDRPLHAGGGAVRLWLGRGRGARTRRSTLDPASPPRAVGRPQTWRTPAGGKRAGRGRARGEVSSGERCRARQRNPPDGAGPGGAVLALSLRAALHPGGGSLDARPLPPPRDNDSHGSSPRQPFQGKSGSLSAVPLNLSFLPAARSLSVALYSTEPFVCFSILAAGRAVS